MMIHGRELPGAHALVPVPCNAFCSGEEHCDLYYVQATEALSHEAGVLLGVSLMQWRVEPVRAKLAAEAGPMPDTFVVLSGTVPPPDVETVAWLVWWRWR